MPISESFISILSTTWQDIENKGWAHIKAKVHYLDVGEDEPQLVFELLDIKKIPEIAESVVSLTQ